MNIIFVSIAAPPVVTGAECLQVGKYIKYLSDQHSIHLITTRLPSDNHWQVKDGSQAFLLSKLNQKTGLPTLTTLGKYAGFLPRLILRGYASKPDSDFLFHHQARIASYFIKVSPDIIYSRSAPFSSAVMGLKLKKILKKPWVMHLSDPWADSAFKKANSYIKNMEARCFENADKISFTSPETLSFYKKKYPKFSDKYFVSPNVFDAAEIAEDKDSFTGDKIKLLYSGEIYGRRSINPIIETLALLDREQQNLLDVRFVGNLDQKSISKIVSANLDCVKYEGFISPAASYLRQRESDILISVGLPMENDVDGVYLPSKIQDYMAARRFILALTGKNSATYNVVEGKYGICFDYNEKDKLLSFWKKLIDAFQNGDHSFLKLEPLDQTFEAEHNVKKLIRIFSELVPGSHAP